MNINNKISAKQQEYINVLHLDRLQLTLKHSFDSNFKNIRNPDLIPERQTFGRIELVLDNSNGSKMYYHTFALYFEGKKVGKLHSAFKFNRPDVEFDFDKYILYCNQRGWWYEIYQAILKDLGLAYSNLNYIELALDSNKNFLDEFSYYHSHATNNKFSIDDCFKPVRETRVDIINNGKAYNIWGSCNMISIYQKTDYAEEFIHDFFRTNGFSNEEVYRVECRMNWNYIKSLINKKHVIITPETLLDDKMLATLFELSVKNKLSYYDLRKKRYDQNRNKIYDKISIIENITFNKTELLKYVPLSQKNHYKTDSTDENIIRQTYYQYLQTGSKNYFKNIRNNAEAALMNDKYVIGLLLKCNQRYKGDLTVDVLDRMDFAVRNYIPVKKESMVTRLLFRLGIKWKQKAI